MQKIDSSSTEVIKHVYSIRAWFKIYYFCVRERLDRVFVLQAANPSLISGISYDTPHKTTTITF